MKLLYKSGALVLVLLFLAAFLKPSHERFKEFTGDMDANGYKIETRKLNDYWVSAIFEKTAFSKDRRGNYHKEYTERYTGYFLNFHLRASASRVEEKATNMVDSSVLAGDTTKL